jgi:hypothetical protein
MGEQADVPSPRFMYYFFGSANSSIAFKSVSEPGKYKIKCSAG